MRTGRTKRKLRSVLAWVLWVILAQVILINISASLYSPEYSGQDLAPFYGPEILPPTPGSNAFFPLFHYRTGDQQWHPDRSLVQQG
jgi:hypothetical protein